VRARATVRLSVAALLMLTLGGGGYLYIQNQAEARRDAADQRVAVAINEVYVRYGEVRTATSANLAIWHRALDAATQAEQLASEPDVGDDARTRAHELRAAVPRDRVSARADAERLAKDAAMHERLLVGRIPVEENTAVGAFRERDAARMDAAYAAAFRDNLDGADVASLFEPAIGFAEDGFELLSMHAMFL
jgi:hypothetical protein